MVNEKQSMWSGYIDILGTRSLAERSTADLQSTLDYFHAVISEDAKHLGDSNHNGGKIALFSDGAFFCTDDLSKFLTFYQIIRRKFFDRGIFFNCAVLNKNLMIEHFRPKGDLKNIFQSFRFGPEAAEIYQAQSSFKGVGCNIIFHDKADLKRYEDKTVQSFFVKQEGRDIKCTKFVDIKMSQLATNSLADHSTSEQFVSDKIIDKIFSAWQLAMMYSVNAGTYYVAVIATIIRSSDFSQVKFNQNREMENVPYVATKLLFARQIVRKLNSLPGSHLLYLCIFNELIKQSAVRDEKAIRQIVRAMENNKNCFRNLDKIPNFIITEQNKKILAEIVTSLD